MARGQESQPSSDHWDEGTKCEIVLYEQSKHRNASKANSKGYAKGKGGASSWQSHHILCLSTLAVRKAKNPETTALLEKSLYITKWNINEAPNMIGLPMYRCYVKEYGSIDKKDEKIRDAAYAAVAPKNLPAHDVDHNTAGGYTEEVGTYLQKNIWDKFDSKDGDHKKDAEWIASQLKAASEYFEGVLLTRGGTRKGGTVSSWRKRFEDEDWAKPFSMARVPTQRFAGRDFSDLADIFSEL